MLHVLIYNEFCLQNVNIPVTVRNGKRNPDKFFIEAVTEKTPVIQRDFWRHSKEIDLLEHYGCVWIVNLYEFVFFSRAYMKNNYKVIFGH